MYTPQKKKPDGRSVDLIQRERSVFHSVRSFGALSIIVTIACVAIDWVTIKSFTERLFNNSPASCFLASSAIALGIDVAPWFLGQLMNLSSLTGKCRGPQAKNHRLQYILLLSAFVLSYLALLLFMFLSVSVGGAPDASLSSGFSTSAQGTRAPFIPSNISILSLFGPAVTRSLLPLVTSAICFAVSYSVFNRQTRIQSLQSALFELQIEIQSEECVIAKFRSDLQNFHPDVMDAEIACERIDLLRVLAEEALIAAKSELAAELGTVEAANSLLADTGLFTNDDYWDRVYNKIRNSFDYSAASTCTVSSFPTSRTG